VTELTFAPSGQYLVARTSQLGRFGCFVKTNPFSSGSTVSLRITYDLRQFVAAGEVVYVLPDKVSHIAGPDQREARLRFTGREQQEGATSKEKASQSIHKQEIHTLAARPDAAQTAQSIPCIQCNRHFLAIVPDKIVSGPFPA
jgi:hypothetical protein